MDKKEYNQKMDGLNKEFVSRSLKFGLTNAIITILAVLIGYGLYYFNQVQFISQPLFVTFIVLLVLAWFILTWRFADKEADVNIDVSKKQSDLLKDRPGFDK